MKKSVIVFLIGALILLTSAVWIISTTGLKPADLVSVGVIILVVGFAIFVGYKRLKSTRRGEPADDELSRKVMQRTAGLSFYISLYIWLAIMYFSDKVRYETNTLIAAGILGMAVTFAVCWLFFNFRGIRND
jgi:peptidoglycan/LPS O-acetylase OafA/YrhL